MKHHGAVIIGLSASLLLGGCASTPMGPTVPVMPAANKPFEVFQQDQLVCKQFAEQQVGGQAESTNTRAIGGAALGTVLGAGLGAAIGGGQGAGIGAASGALLGTGVGAGTSGGTQLTIQQQYDNAYSQCMYSKGNQVPGFQPAAVYAPPPPPPPAPPPAPPAAAHPSAYDRGLVRDTQSELVRLGLLTGPADGSYGPRTGAAISEYERRNNLLVDGTPSAALLAHMRAH
jgi:peptidoglycan hydrolase-like protein with peptidoglycan-binding domain